jgi:hypothetical protein
MCNDYGNRVPYSRYVDEAAGARGLTWSASLASAAREKIESGS